MFAAGCRRMAVVVVALAAVVAGCGDDGSPAADPVTGRPTGTITVLAASSLTGALTEIATAFEQVHEDVEVAVSFDASSTLATQILEGAPADVFASADDANMAKVTSAGSATDPVVFATNELTIVVPAGNPAEITGLRDLGRPGLTVALCAPEVPCGRYAAEAFAKAGLSGPSAGEETNVKGVVTKVGLGEADAGIAYVTDVAADSSVDGVELADDEQVTASYPVAVLADAPNPTLAGAFVAFLTGDEAQAILRRAGFGTA